ncbi:LPXTG cell wall anchor domain protein, partial [Actinomyces sp. ICM58]
GAPRGGLARTGATTQGLPVAVAMGVIGVAGLWARRRNRYQSENK